MSDQQQVTEAREEIHWYQPFRWGQLLAFDDENEWFLPDNLGESHVVASPSCLAVQVHHSYDVNPPDDWPDDLGIPLAHVSVIIAFVEAPPETPAQFDGDIACHSGLLTVGDAENERVVEVPAGIIRVQVSLFPLDDADIVVLRVLPAR